MTKNSASSLFLHWGPGGHAGVERAWFGTSLPVVWWNQPKIEAGVVDPFEFSVSAAQKRLLQIRDTAGGLPVPILAHSFGGQIALELARRVPDVISSVTLLGCGAIPGRPFIFLAEKISAEDANHASLLETELNAAKKALTIETVGALAGKLVSIPGLFDRYWSPASAEQKARYQKLAASQPEPIDLGTFGAVMKAFLEHKKPSGPVGYRGPVRLIAGAEDPLFRLKEEEAAWKASFPQMTVERVQSGHFIQFECEAKDWLPKS